jgi:hypothetical protein
MLNAMLPAAGAAEEFDVYVHGAGVEPWLAGGECGRCLLGTGSERGEAVRDFSTLGLLDEVDGDAPIAGGETRRKEQIGSSRDGGSQKIGAVGTGRNGLIIGVGRTARVNLADEVCRVSRTGTGVSVALVTFTGDAN